MYTYIFIFFALKPKINVDYLYKKNTLCTKSHFLLCL